MHRKYHILLPIGGHVELDETPWQAIAHELSEESGYSLDELHILQPPHRIRHLPEVKLHPYPVVLNTHKVSPDHSHSDTAFAFTATTDPQGHIADGESLDLRWLTRQELDALHEPEIYLHTKVAYQFVFEECLAHWEQVPTSSFEF
jgi:8-oxo-dGTP diphosphatase